MMNEGGPFNLAEIWQFPLNGVSSAGDSSRRSFAGPNQFGDTDLTTPTNGDPARMSHALSQAVIEGISGAWKRREDESKSAKIVSINGAVRIFSFFFRFDSVFSGLMVQFEFKFAWLGRA